MLSKTRNFVIISHIDHGKSTLADRFLELTGTVDFRKMKPQYLDRLESERERGITIKMAPVRMNWNGYILNLIDTPGHSDFSYEVSRALEAVEGAILLVDATQGIQAQTLVNFRLAQKAGLKIIPAVNKIDLLKEERGFTTEVDILFKEISEMIGCEMDEIYRISGKTGEGVKELIEAVIEKVPPPIAGDAGFKEALVFDSLYDDHKGVIAFVRVMSGEYKLGDEVMLMAVGEKIKIKEVGIFCPETKSAEKLSEGEIGYIATGIKDPDKLRIGDTIGNKAVAGYEPPRPVIFVSLYPNEADDYDDLKQALGKLKLNDSALVFEPDFNEVLGRGFKAGFLGQLHFEIVAERLEKEFNIETVSTFPSVAYKVKIKGQYQIVKNLEEMPEEFDEVLEPVISLEIITPSRFLGSVLQLKEVFRMKDIEFSNLENKVIITAKMPLVSLVSDFDSQLKSSSEGMASFSYEVAGEEKADVFKVKILVANDPVPGLTRLVYKDEIDRESRRMLEKLKELLPRQLFVQALQAVAGSRIIARENIPAIKKELGNFGKNGGDRTRKMKLWKKQQEGKKRLKETGRVTVSSEVFKELLKKN